MASYTAFATVEATLPLSVYQWPSKWYVLRNRAVYLQDYGKPEQKRMIASDDDVMSILFPPIDARASLDARAFIAGINNPNAVKSFLPEVTAYDGVPLGILEEPFEFDLIKSNNQPRYSEARRKKEIIVSDYQKGSGVLRHLPSITASSGGNYARYLSIPEILGYGDITVSPTQPFELGGRHWVELPYVYVIKRKAVWTEHPPVRLYTVDEFKTAFQKSLKRYPHVMTKVVANANTATVDLLTAAAELPKTLKSILKGCISIYKMYKDAKRGEIRFNDHVAKIRYEWNKDRAILLKNKDIAGLKTAERQFNKNVKDITDKIAGLWLNYRLQIKPTASDIEKTLDALAFGDHNVDFIRFREASREDIAVLGALGQVEFRAFIKRGIKPGAQFDAYFSASGSVTAWELVPLSFVIDRYINIGDWIAANLISSNKYSFVEGATISWLCEDTFAFSSTVSCEVKFYKQQVFQSGDYCPLYMPKSRTRDQSLDHLALIWLKLLSK